LPGLPADTLPATMRLTVPLATLAIRVSNVAAFTRMSVASTFVPLLTAELTARIAVPVVVVCDSVSVLPLDVLSVTGNVVAPVVPPRLSCRMVTEVLRLMVGAAV